MRKKKLVSRFLVFMVALIMLITCLPPNFIASALGGVGGGQSLEGTGGGDVGNNDSLLNEEIGLRFSLVSLKNGKPTVIETYYKNKYFIDVWVQNTVLADKYRSMTPNTRYATEKGDAVTTNNVLYYTTGMLNTTINNTLKSAYGGSVTANFNISSILYDSNTSLGAVFNEYSSGGEYKFDVNGKKFYNWGLDDTSITVTKPDGTNEAIPNMEAFINIFYSTKLPSLDLTKTFLTIEPLEPVDTISAT